MTSTRQSHLKSNAYSWEAIQVKNNRNNIAQTEQLFRFSRVSL